jgi:hypothetical protein
VISRISRSDFAGCASNTNRNIGRTQGLANSLMLNELRDGRSNMTERKQHGPEERLLAALDGYREVEHFAIDEIEALPLDVVRASIRVLGLDPDLPPSLARLLFTQPSIDGRVIDALERHDPHDDEIASLGLDDVHAVLHKAGINYRAGIAQVHRLVATRPTTDPANALTDRDESVVAFRARKVRRIGLYSGVVGMACAVAAAVCFFSLTKMLASGMRLQRCTPNWTLHLHYGTKRRSHTIVK